MASNRIAALEMASIDSGTLTGGFDLLYDKLGHACSIIRIINASNKAVTISYDGTTDNDYIPATNTLHLYLQASKMPNGNLALLAKRTKIYVKGVAGTGFIYATGYYTD